MASVYIKGFVGNLGTKILIENKYDELSKYFNAYFLRKALNDINGGSNPPLFMSYDDLIDVETSKKIIDKESITKGGMLAALWRICDRNKCGLKYTLSNVPILQGTIEISNYFDINPYRLLTSDAEILLVDVDEEDNNEENTAYKKYASFIGYTTNEKRRVRIDNDIESFLTKDYKDEIDKVIPKFIKHYEKHSNSQK